MKDFKAILGEVDDDILVDDDQDDAPSGAEVMVGSGRKGRYVSCDHLKRLSLSVQIVSSMKLHIHVCAFACACVMYVRAYAF